MTKQRPELNYEHLDFIKRGVKFLQKEEHLIQESVASLPKDRFSDILEHDFEWVSLYELSIKQISILLVYALDLLPYIKEQQDQGVEINQILMNLNHVIDASLEKIEAAFAHLNKKPSADEIKNVRVGLGKLFSLSDLFALIFALLGNFAALRKFGKDMHQLIDEASKGSEESLLHAIRIDPTATSCSPILKRISIAHMQGDKDFIHLLGNALKSKWNKPKFDYEALRVLLNACHDAGLLGGMSQNGADKLFIQELEVYSNEGEDPARGLFKFIQRWKNK